MHRRAGPFSLDAVQPRSDLGTKVSGTSAPGSTRTGSSIPPNGRISVSSKPRRTSWRSPVGVGSFPALGPHTRARSSGFRRRYECTDVPDHFRSTPCSHGPISAQRLAEPPRLGLLEPAPAYLRTAGYLSPQSRAGLRGAHPWAWVHSRLWDPTRAPAVPASGVGTNAPTCRTIFARRRAATVRSRHKG